MKRFVLHFLALGLGFLVASCGDPAKTIICPWAPGGGTDDVSRFFAQQLERELGRPCIVVNKTGGGGAVGHQAGARARPDGDTLLMGTFELSTMHWMGISPLTYADYTPLMQVNADPAAIIVQADAPWQSLEAFIEHIRENPSTIKLSGTSSGGAWDLARAGLMLAAGLKPKDAIWVPTEGSKPSIVQLLGGHIDAVCCSIPEAAPQIDAGTLRPLAVMADDRVPEYPHIPTAKEAGIDWSAVGWRGFLLPKNTPEAAVQELANALDKIVKSAAYQTFMGERGYGVTIRRLEEFERFLAKQDAQWKEVIEAAGYSANR